MRTPNHAHPHTVRTVRGGRRVARDETSLTPRVRPQLVAEGVIVGYIHEISLRHRDGDSGAASFDLSAEAEAA